MINSTRLTALMAISMVLVVTWVIWPKTPEPTSAPTTGVVTTTDKTHVLGAPLPPVFRKRGILRGNFVPEDPEQWVSEKVREEGEWTRRQFDGPLPKKPNPSIDSKNKLLAR